MTPHLTPQDRDMHGGNGVHRAVVSEAQPDLQRIAGWLADDVSLLSDLDRDGRTPLDVALAGKAEPWVDLLRELGAQKAEDVSPTAALMSSGEARAIVLAWRAELGDGQRWGTEAVAWASRANRPDVMPYLATDAIETADLNRWEREAVLSGQTQVVTALLTLHADPNAEEQGERMLHAAARVGGQGVVATLLRGGADVNATDGHGQTALHLAVKGRNTGSILNLLAAGANPRAKTQANLSAFDLAAISGLPVSLESLVMRVQREREAAAKANPGPCYAVGVEPPSAAISR